MKNFIAACLLSLVSCSAFASECPCKAVTKAVVSTTSKTARSVVSVPANVLRGVRSRATSRRTVRRVRRYSNSNGCGC